jgi:anti-sigma factor RsiW
MTEHQDCQKFFERLSELLDGELDQATGDQIVAHLESCPDCLVCWTTFKKSVEIFHHLGPEPLPEDFVPRLREFIGEHL